MLRRRAEISTARELHGAGSAPVVVNVGLTFPARNMSFGDRAGDDPAPKGADQTTKGVCGMARSVASADFVRQLEGFSLTTAEILYRLPDHPALLQSYVWQDYDLAPNFRR